VLDNIPHQRTGQGFDVHAFDHDKETPATTQNIRLFGVDIPHYKTLLGHSDADVGLHALCDAIYGICGNGDIGVHFPPSKEEHKGQDSTEFLSHALAMLKSCGGTLLHIDLTLIGEEPKMTPNRAKIILKLASLTGLTAHQIGLKATTSEKLGFTGRKEGLACLALATAYFENGFIKS
jgi:2-C-methyl-D-erythritol 4-phosphate cytidylyltransferase/2-C-methyl-D-erythritol 2,4-cyclodiphosphate synthase